MTTVRLNKFLCQRAAKAAKKAGYSSVEEFIEQAIERNLAQFEEPESKEDVMRKLKDPGYLD